MTQAEMIARIRVLERLVERLLCRSKKARDLVQLGFPFPADEEQTGHVHHQWMNRFSEEEGNLEREYRWFREYQRIFGGEPV